MPTGQQVADRAGLALRTVFRHFSDMESLYASVSERVREMVQPHLEELPQGGTTEARIDALVRHRCEIFQMIAPYQRSSRARLWNSPFLKADHARFVQQQRANLRHGLPEVVSLPVPAQQIAELVVSFEGWDRMRQEQALSSRRTAGAMREALRILLQSSA